MSNIHFDTPKTRWTVWAIVASVLVTLGVLYLSYREVPQTHAGTPSLRTERAHAGDSTEMSGTTLNAIISFPFGTGNASGGDEREVAVTPTQISDTASVDAQEQTSLYSKYGEDLRRLEEAKDKYADGNKCPSVLRAYDKQFLTLAISSSEKDTLEFVTAITPEESDAWKTATRKLDEIYRTLILSTDNVDRLHGIARDIPKPMTAVALLAKSRHDDILLAESSVVTDPEDLVYQFRSAFTDSAKDALAAKIVNALIARKDIERLHGDDDMFDFYTRWYDVFRRNPDNPITQLFDTAGHEQLRRAQTEDEVYRAYRLAPYGTKSEREAADRLNSMSGATLAQVTAADLATLDKLHFYSAGSVYEAYLARKKVLERELIQDMDSEALKWWVRQNSGFRDTAPPDSPEALAWQRLNTLKPPCPE